MSTLITGLKQGTTGEEVPVLVDSSGRLVVTGVSGVSGVSGGSSDTTEATQLQVLAKATSIDSKVLTNAQLRATPLDVNLPSGSATAANQATANTSLSNIDTKTPALVGGSVPVTVTANVLATGAATSANQTTLNTNVGSTSDARATWFDQVSGIIGLLKLLIATSVGAGSRTYVYTSGVLTSETWTLFGTTRTKTYTYTNNVLTGESDWV